MQILKSLHQKFDTKPLLWSEKLFVFMPGGETASFDEKIDTAENKDPKDKEKTLTDPKEIKAEAKREFDNAIKKLGEAYKNENSYDGTKLSTKESTSSQLFNKKSSEFQNKLGELTNKSEEDKAGAINKLVKEGNTLLDKIKARITASKEKGTEDDKKFLDVDTKEVSENSEKSKAQLNEKIQTIINDITKNISENSDIKIETNTLATEIINKLDLNDEKINELISSKDFKLNTEQMKVAKDAVINILPTIDEYNDEEGELIHDLLTDNTRLDDLFDHDDDPLRQYISMRYKISKVKEGEKDVLTIDGDKITKTEDLKKYLPKKDGDKLDALLKAKEDEDGYKENIKNLEVELNKQGKESVKSLMVMKELKIVLKTVEVKEGGMFNSLKGILQAFQAIMAAFKSSDWDTVGDVLEDVKNSKSPSDEIKLAKESYAGNDAFSEDNGETNTRKLLTAYMNPRGDEADELLGGDNAHQKYRGELKSTIQTYLGGKLGIKIKSITKLKNGSTEIRGTNESEKDIGIQLIKATDGNMKGKIVEYTEKDGKTTYTQKNTLSDIKDIKNIKDKLGGDTSEIKVAEKEVDKEKDKYKAEIV